jgi:hypothetical protein
MEVAAMEVLAVAAGALLLIGFVCCYSVRALVSRWHRVKGRTTAFRMYGGGSHTNAEAGPTRDYFPKGQWHTGPSGGVSVMTIAAAALRGPNPVAMCDAVFAGDTLGKQDIPSS